MSAPDLIEPPPQEGLGAEKNAKPDGNLSEGARGGMEAAEEDGEASVRGVDEREKDDDDSEHEGSLPPPSEEEEEGLGEDGEEIPSMREEEVVQGKSGEEPIREATHRRRHCPSFRLLLRRQLWVNTVRVAATLRRLFRSRRSTQGNKKRKGEVGESAEENTPTADAPSPTRRLFPALIEGSSGKVGPSEPLVGAAAAASSPRGVRQDPTSSAASSTASSPAKSSFGALFRRSSAAATPLTSLPPSPQAPSPVPAAEPNARHMRLVRSRRLLKEFHELTKVQMAAKEPIFSVDLVNDCLYEWKVKLYRIDPESELSRDMVEFNVPYILLNMSFPEAFPFQPPFLRVLAPRLEKGFVMEGGAICMELLTPRGWASAYTIEAVIMQFAASLVKGQGRISRKHKNSKEFNKRSAEASFRSLVKTHDKYGWVTPPLAEG